MRGVDSTRLLTECDVLRTELMPLLLESLDLPSRQQPQPPGTEAAALMPSRHSSSAVHDLIARTTIPYCANISALFRGVCGPNPIMAKWTDDDTKLIAQERTNAIVIEASIKQMRDAMFKIPFYRPPDYCCTIRCCEDPPTSHPCCTIHRCTIL